MMSQTPSNPCPQCGTPVLAGQRFCSNCGATTDVGAVNPTSYSSGEETYAPTPPPPPGSNEWMPKAAPIPAYPQQPRPGFQPSSPIQQEYQPPIQSAQPLPAYVKPQKDSSKSVIGQIGCGVGVIILLILLVLGTVGYLGYRWISSSLANVSTNTTTGTGSNSGNGNRSTPSVPLTTAQINAQITYSSVEITILNAQKASSFADDSGANTPVLVRLNIKEQNPTNGSVYLQYGDAFRLILPDGTSVNPNAEHDGGAINQTITRTNWIDFPLSSDVDISKMTLRLGAASEAQMDIPLTGNADLGKYQLKTISPNKSFQYAKLNWTLTTVTSSLSANGKQAESGMRYIVVTLKVDNPTSDYYYFNTNNTMRLQAGSTTSPPTNSTAPFDNNIAAGTTNETGTVTFLMPQNSSSFTLLMLARTDTTPPASQVTTDFQI